jgi:hypothetical protein
MSRFLRWHRPDPRRSSSATARIPVAAPVFRDDSWGLVLVPIVACVAFLVSAIVWL